MSINLKRFYDEILNNDISFFTGVPDSLLKSICGFIEENTALENHIIAANEGSAIAIGAGYYLATGKTPLIYMQNSGLGAVLARENFINPATAIPSAISSLVHSIYGSIFVAITKNKSN